VSCGENDRPEATDTPCESAATIRAAEMTLFGETEPKE
jgi:hypothetical protein